MKNPMAIIAYMGMLGAGMTLAPLAYADWLPDGLIGSPKKVSKQRQEDDKKKSDEVKAKTIKKERAARQQVYLTRQFIKRDNSRRLTIVRPPDYSGSSANATGKRK